MPLVKPYTHTFFGILCTQEEFIKMLGMKASGECPFCHRTGLKKQYGADKKHIAACAQKAQSDVERPSDEKQNQQK
jgi:hypothetical protein